MGFEPRIGSVLMSRRIELGLSLEQAARDTNIRARMLELLESADFSRYPPRGHAIGMLSSYARFLGMDSAAIVEMFDDEFAQFNEEKESGGAAGASRRGSRSQSDKTPESRSRPANRERARSKSSRRRNAGEPESRSKMSQNLKDEADAKDNERYKTGSVRVVGTRQTGSFRSVGSSSSRSRSARRATSASEHRPSSRANAGEDRPYPSSRRARPSTRRDTAVSSRSQEIEESRADDAAPNFFGIDVDTGQTTARRPARTRTRTRERDAADARSAASGNDTVISRAAGLVKAALSERRTRLIILAFSIIVIAVVIVASILIGTAGNNRSGVIEVSGGVTNDTMTTEGESASHKTITTANGNPVVIKIEVARGETSLVEIMYDGANAYKGTAVGGQFSREFPVTESFSATFSNASAVTVTENGNPIDIALNEDGKSGSLYISIQSTPR